MSVLIVGSIALDSVKTPFGTRKNILGGSCVYSAFSAHFFTDVKIVGVVGDDFPKKYILSFKKRKIDIRGLKIEKGKTFRWSGYYDYNLNIAHTISTQLNVFSSFTPKIPEEYKDIKYIFLANISPDLQLSVLSQLRSPKLVIADTMNFWIENEKELLLKMIKKVNILLLNDAEVKQLTGESNLIFAARKIILQGPEVVIIKKGEHGCLMLAKNDIFATPAFPLEVVKDPTGAGDSFAGAFIGYLSQKDSINPLTLRAAVVYGSVIASFTVEDFSINRLANITFNDIKERCRQFRQICYFEEL